MGGEKIIMRRVRQPRMHPELFALSRLFSQIILYLHSSRLSFALCCVYMYAKCWGFFLLALFLSLLMAVCFCVEQPRMQESARLELFPFDSGEICDYFIMIHHS
jgi:hypothetical protein